MVILQEASGEGHFMNVYYHFKVLHKETEKGEENVGKMGVSCSHSYVSGKGDELPERVVLSIKGTKE